MLGDARITVVEQIYHQCRDQEPVPIRTNFTRFARILEQPYVRWCKASTEWQSIDLGWITKVLGLLVIRNEAQLPKMRLNEKGIKEYVEPLTFLHVGFSSEPHYWILPPGESFKGLPSDSSNVVIRSTQEGSRYVVYGLPE